MNQAKKTDQKRNTILRVAKKLFWENGYESTTTRQICDVSNISTGLLFFYFESKNVLFNNVIDDIFNDFFDVIKKYAFARNEPFQRYSTAMMFAYSMLLENEKFRKLYRSALNSSSTWMLIAHKLDEFMKILLEDSGYEINDDFFPNILALCGAERALLINVIDGNISIGIEEAAAILLRVGLSSFKIMPDEIDKLIDDARSYVQSRHTDFSKTIWALY